MCMYVCILHDIDVCIDIGPPRANSSVGNVDIAPPRTNYSRISIYTYMKKCITCAPHLFCSGGALVTAAPCPPLPEMIALRSLRDR